MRNRISIAVGFIILFFLYHIPEFFQRYYNSPLLWLLELGMLLMILVSYFIIKAQKGEGFSAFGLFKFKEYKSNLFKGLLIGIAFSVLANLISVWLNWNRISIDISLKTIIIQTLVFAIGTLLPSLAEDILTRGYLFAHWKNRKSNLLFVFISALLFTLNHIFRLTHVDVMIYIFILSIVLAWCLIYTGSLWLTLGIHWGTNIAYQFFANVITLKTLKETGLDNYLLAACYLLALIVVMILYRIKFFKVSLNLKGWRDSIFNS